MRNFVASVVSVWVITCLPPIAAADPVQITSGFFRIDHEGDFYRLVGEGLLLENTRVFGFEVPKILTGASCFVPFTDERCAPGETLNISFTTGNGDVDLGTGSATVDGTPFADVNFRGRMEFSAAPFEFPNQASGPAGFPSVQMPFTFSGFIHGLDGGEELFRLQLFGSGTVSMPWDVDVLTGGFASEESSATFTFADAPEPVPEPATLLLFGAGAAAMVGRRLQRPH
jgi:hypothetical protein